MVLPLALDALSMPAALLDVDGAIIDANGPLVELLFSEPVRWVGAQLAVALDHRAIETRHAGERIQYRIEIADRSTWWRVTLSPLDNGCLALLVDITEELRAYEQLKFDSRTRDQLMRDAEIGTWRYDPDAEVYHFSNELSLGYEGAGEPVPVSMLQLIQHKDDRARDAEIREHIINEGGAADVEIRFLDGQGGWRHLRALFRSGNRLPSGKFEMYGLSQNITDLAKARDEANSLAQRLNLALTAAGAGVFEYDFKRKTNWMSPELCDLIGPGPLEQFKLDPPSLYHPDDRQAVRALFFSPAAPGKPDSIDARIMRADGPLWVRIYWQTIIDHQGCPRRGVGLALNIDSQKRQEMALNEARTTAEAAKASQSNFLAAVSHEIRTPMNGMVGVLHLLRREPLSDEGHDLLAEALSCSEMLSHLIHDVLDFSKMEAGKLEIAPIPTDPAAVIDSVVTLLHPQADIKNLHLRIRPGLSGHVLIDPVRLRQCLFNVIGNAIKFTERGGVEVRACFVDAPQGQMLRCEVEDSGIGIDPASQTSLFDRFQQADSGTNRKFGGTGLGLAISRSLTRMMGGDMGFSSRPGKGSTFWFEIAAPASEAPIIPVEADAGSPLEGLKILLVDDNRTNRLVGLKTLEALGAAAETVDSGEAALTALARDAFDLILMDINMPGMDGMEATRQIRALPGEAAATPIVALTADVMTHHQAAYHAAGMNGFVPKPFSPSDLLAEIARLVS